MMNGSTIGNYRVVRRIGVGGMGEVFEVEHLQLGMRYALRQPDAFAAMRFADWFAEKARRR